MHYEIYFRMQVHRVVTNSGTNEQCTQVCNVSRDIYLKNLFSRTLLNPYLRKNEFDTVWK